MSDKIHLRLKDKYMPPTGDFIHTRGTTRIQVSSTEPHEFDLKTARVALDLKDDQGERKFELTSPPPPVPTERALPEDFPHRDRLMKNYGTLERVADAPDEDLLKVKGIGEASLAEIRAYEPRPVNIDETAPVVTEEGDNNG